MVGKRTAGLGCGSAVELSRFVYRPPDLGRAGTEASLARSWGAARAGDQRALGVLPGLIGRR